MSDTNGSQPTLAPIETLIKDPKNAKLHTDLDINAIAASLGAFGQQTPIVINAERVIIKGNGTYEAARKLGWSHVYTVSTELDEIEQRAYAIADNQTASLSEWDYAKLQDQVESLSSDMLNDLAFDPNLLAALQSGEVIPETQYEIPDQPAPDSSDSYSVRIEKLTESQADQLHQAITQRLRESGLEYQVFAK